MATPELRFLADESCDFAVVRALRAEGYDVLAVSDVMQRSDDRELIEQAHREKRILLTEDKDFGWLVGLCEPCRLGRGHSGALSRERPTDAGSGRHGGGAGAG